MIKQIDRVIGDLNKQVEQFRRGDGNPICVAIVGINQADVCTGYEGERVNITDGKTHKHPRQECAEAERRILQSPVKTNYDEVVILRYKATNAAPFEFEWVDEKTSELDYAAALTRVSRRYDSRFGGFGAKQE